MSILARNVVVLLALAACDMIHAKGPPKLEESKHNASGDRSGLLACYDDCTRQQLEPTDEATCRANCEMAFKVTPTAADPVFDAAAKCLHECGDSRPCAKRCKRRARTADKALTAEALRRLEDCVGACDAEEHDPGNRWTCVRNCAQTTRTEGPAS